MVFGPAVLHLAFTGTGPSSPSSTGSPPSTLSTFAGAWTRSWTRWLAEMGPASEARREAAPAGVGTAPRARGGTPAGAAQPTFRGEHWAKPGRIAVVPVGTAVVTPRRGSVETIHNDPPRIYSKVRELPASLHSRVGGVEKNCGQPCRSFAAPVRHRRPARRGGLTARARSPAR